MARTNTLSIPIMHMIYGLRVGGAERFVLDLCKGLDRDRFKVEVVYFHREEQLLGEFLDAGVPCTLFPVRPVEFPLSDLWRLARFVRGRSPALVHVHLYHASRIGALSAYLGGVRTIVRTKHSVRDPGAKLGKRGRLWKLLLAPVITRTVAVSHAIARQTGTPFVIYDGVDTDFFSLDAVDKRELAAYARELGVDGAPVIAVVGRLAREKGHDVLLAALPDLVSEWPRLTLLIAGDGDQLSSLTNLANRLGLTDNVRFLGPVSRVRELLASADLFVQPSRREGLGIAVLEAMSMARPVVATTAGGLTEIISGDVDGVLVEPDDAKALAGAMRKVLRDQNLSRGLAHNARQKVIEGFSLASMIRKYEDLYQDLLQ